MSQNPFIQAIIDSLNSQNEEVRANGENAINVFLGNPETIKTCIDILMNEQNDQFLKYAAVYLHKLIKLFWKSLDIPIRQETQQLIFQVLVNRTFSTDTSNTFLDSVKYIYSHDETKWPDLINFVHSIRDKPFCLSILNKIIPKMDPEDVIEMKDFLLEISLFALTSGDLGIGLLGTDIYHKSIVKLETDCPGPTPHVQALLNLASLSAQYNYEFNSIVWSCIHDILIYGCITDEMFPSFLNIAIQVSENDKIDTDIRRIAVEALMPKLDTFPADLLNKIFSISIDITAKLIELKGSLEETFFSYFENSGTMIEHQTLYPMIQNHIHQAFESQSFYHQISGLLIFQVLLVQFPDLVYNDIEFVTSFLMNCLSTTEDLLKEAALIVIQSFVQSFKSSNVYSPHFLPLIVPNLLSPNVEVSTQSFHAIGTICDHIDKKIPNFLDQYLQIYDQITENNFTEYADLLGQIMDSTDGFSDENCDQIINIISSVIESNDKVNISIILNIGVALIRQDESQLDYVIQTLFPFVEIFLTNEDCAYSSIINGTFDFIGNMAEILRFDSPQYFQPLLPHIARFLDNKEIKEDYKTGIVINSSRLAKFCGPLANDLISHIIPNIESGLKSENEDFQQQSACSIIKIKRLLNPEVAKILFNDLIECLNSAPDYNDYIDDVILAASKLLAIADPSNLNEFLGQTIKFVQSVFDSTWLLLQEKPIFQSPAGSKILAPLSYLFSSIFQYQTAINDTICQFLIQWIQKNNEIDLSEIVGTLSDCLKYKNVSEEMRQAILNSVIEIMKTAKEASLLQNLTYLLNVLIQDEAASALIPSIVELIPVVESWRVLADNSQFGYREVSANIASLYLQLAIRVQNFPQQLIVYSIEQFPPFDYNETSSMAAAIMKLITLPQNQSIVGPAALAFVRFLLQDDASIEKAKVNPELRAAIVQFLKSVCAQQGMLNTIRASYAKQNSKLRKIMSILNS